MRDTKEVTHWYLLAIHLGIKTFDLKEIEKNFGSNDNWGEPERAPH